MTYRRDLKKVEAALALAQTALDLGWTCPTVVDDACLVLKDARHPLQELAVPEFIPNDALRGLGVGRRGGGDGRGGFQYRASIIGLVALGRAFGPARRLHDELGVGALEPQLRPLGGGGLFDALRTI